MPSILFHELVGHEFAKKHKNYNNKEFILGIIVPDAVNAYGFASKENRWKSHCRDKNLDKWILNIVEFYKENKEKYEKYYLMGYLLHVLTDIFCDKIYNEQIYPDLLEKGYNYETAYKFYELELEKIENNKINSLWWKKVKESFKSTEKTPISNINKKMIEDWEKYIIEKYSTRKYEEQGYISDKFVNKVLEGIELTLIQNKIKI